MQIAFAFIVHTMGGNTGTVFSSVALHPEYSRWSRDNGPHLDCPFKKLPLLFYLQQDTISEKSSVGRFPWQCSQTSDHQWPSLIFHFKGITGLPLPSIPAWESSLLHFQQALWRQYDCACRTQLDVKSGLMVWQSQMAGWAGWVEFCGLSKSLQSLYFYLPVHKK